MAGETPAHHPQDPQAPGSIDLPDWLRSAAKNPPRGTQRGHLLVAVPHRWPTAPAHPPARLPTTQQLVKESCTVGAQGNALELLQLAEEVLDQVPPLVHLTVNVEQRRAARMLGDDGLGAALVQVRDNVIAVESGIADQRPKGEPVDERRHAHRVEALPWQEHKTHQIAERIRQGQDFAGQAAFGAANGLAQSPPFAPCPCRWTLTMVASTRAYSRSGSSETASNRRCQTSAFTQSRKRVKTLFQFPNEGGRSRQGLPVRTTHKTASTNRRLSLPLRPGSPGLPKQRGSICAHWASVSTKRSIRGVNHSPARMKSVNPNRP